MSLKYPINKIAPGGACTRGSGIRALLVALSWPLLCGFGVNAPVDEKDKAFSEGRYADMAKAAEADVARNGNTENLLRLCYALSKLKRYAGIFTCLDTLAARIRSGDTSGGRVGSWLGRPSWFATSHVLTGLTFGTVEWDVAAYPHLLRAEARIELGDYPRAVDSARQAARLLPKRENQVPFFRIRANALLGLAHALGGNRKAALEQVKLLLDEDVASFSSSSLEIQRNTALARIHLALREYANALATISRDSTSFLRAGADLFAGVPPGESLFTFELLPRSFMLHKAQLETGRVSEAKSGYDALLARPATRDNGEIYWMILFDRGRIAEREGDAPAAIEFYRRAIEVIEAQRASINTEASKIGFVGDKQAVYARLIGALVERGRAPEAFDYVERSKSRALVDLLASKRDFAIHGADPEKTKSVLFKLESAEFALRTQHAAGDAAPGSALRELQTARLEIRQTAPELSTLVTVGSVPSDDLMRNLGTQQTLVEYYYDEKYLYAFVVDREKLRVAKFDAAGLVQQIREFRNALAQFGTQRWRSSAQALYVRLWRPIESMLGGTNVVIVPHGALHYLPFGALTGPDGGFLIDRIGMRFLPSASVLKFLKATGTTGEAKLLVLGNPDLGDPKLDLGFAEGEARALATIVPDSRLLVRKEASETNFRKAGSAFSRVHFATHGKFQADDPLSSGLYLARDGENDGVLTVGELYSMSLNADLVTLSACETGLGKIANGDDVVGLTRGFLYAGSRSIVASLWSVDDRATAELMKSFYAGLGKFSKHEALRQAQIKTRESFPHPFFWAAFQLTGGTE